MESGVLQSTGKLARRFVHRMTSQHFISCDGSTLPQCRETFETAVCAAIAELSDGVVAVVAMPSPASTKFVVFKGSFVSVRAFESSQVVVLESSPDECNLGLMVFKVA